MPFTRDTLSVPPGFCKALTVVEDLCIYHRHSPTSHRYIEMKNLLRPRDTASNTKNSTRFQLYNVWGAPTGKQISVNPFTPYCRRDNTFSQAMPSLNHRHPHIMLCQKLLSCCYRTVVRAPCQRRRMGCTHHRCAVRQMCSYSKIFRFSEAVSSPWTNICARVPLLLYYLTSVVEKYR